MTLALISILGGLLLLAWSADHFIEGAAATAHYAGISPLLIGMLIVGFGTSFPEMVVSAFAAFEGNPGLALGNAFGSNITNIGLILGMTTLLTPLTVHSKIIRKELPLLAVIGLFSFFLICDGKLSRQDGWLLLFGFLLLIGWSVFSALTTRTDALADEINQEFQSHPSLSRHKALWLLIGGLIVLVASSRLLVWGAVSVAKSLGVSDLVIGLTIVALGTSLPELAASISAARKGEHDIALGNVIGSNMFNLLAVVGIASVIHPLETDTNILRRDWPVMMGMNLILFVMAYGFRGQGRINRFEGFLLLCSYIGYTYYLISTSLPA